MGVPPNFDNNMVAPAPLDLSGEAAAFDEISEKSYQLICEYVLNKIGITLGANKQLMVAARLAKRLRQHNISNYDDYFLKTTNGTLLGEEQAMLDLLTTNETYLFRELAHFNFLRDKILAHWNTTQQFRCWSAACSTGEEAYSLGMTIDDTLHSRDWEIVASDISHRALKIAQTGKLSMQRISSIPQSYLHAYCKKGINTAEGRMLINRSIREKIDFKSINLSKPINSGVGMFDVIFLRNVLIYFDEEMRNKIVKNIIANLKIGGYFFISHTENITNVSSSLQMVQPSIYRKVAA